MKRTTVVLDDRDQAMLHELCQVLRTSEMEAVRRSIRLAIQVLTWEGEVVLRLGNEEKYLMLV